MRQRYSCALQAAIVALAASGCATEGASEASVDRWSREYVRLLNDGDVAGLRDHLNNPGQAQDAEKRMSRDGRKNFRVESIASVQEMGSLHLVTIDVENPAPSELTIGLVWEGGGWVAVPLP